MTDTLPNPWPNFNGRLGAGLKEGIDEDELVARQIGLPDPSKMSTTQEKYKERIKEKLLEVQTPCSTVLIHNSAPLLSPAKVLGTCPLQQLNRVKYNQ